MKANISIGDEGHKEIEIIEMIGIEGVDAFIRRELEGGYYDEDGQETFLPSYKIYEWSSGTGMSQWQETKKDAIKQATELCKKYGPEYVQQRIAEMIEQYGRAND